MGRMMKHILTLIVIAGLFASCSGPQRDPAIVFMPDMYYAVPYDPYEKATFNYPYDTDSSAVPLFAKGNNMTALIPVAGTVPHNEIGTLPYLLPDNNDGYNASMSLKSPLDAANSAKNLVHGEKLYIQACATCHGLKGDGQGPIVVTGAYLGVPAYKDRAITEGSVYHVIMYGRNAMGSYASQLTESDRWRVAEYVMKLKNN